MLAVLLAGEQDPAPVLLAPEALDGGEQRALENVVGEHHDAVPLLNEVLREPERLGDASGPLLVGVQEPVTAVGMPVAEQAEELPGMRPAGDDHDLVDARAYERLDRVLDHRPVVDRQQVLVRDPRQRVEPRTGSAGEDDALHRPDATSG